MTAAGRCPLCGAQTERVRAADGGAIEEPMISGVSGDIVRRCRPATFYACPACEWCAEDAPEAWR
jgi:hypothetical protein